MRRLETTPKLSVSCRRGSRHPIMKCKFALCVLIIMAALDANAQPKPSATLIVTNAAVYTVENSSQKPRQSL